MSSVICTNLTVITPSTLLPIDVDYARKHLRALSHDEDDLLEEWIRAAAQYWEEQTGRAILHTTYEYWLDAFPYAWTTVPTRIVLPRAPLVSVDALVYTDADGNDAVFTDGLSPETVYWTTWKPAGLYAGPGWVEPISGQVWPTPLAQSGAVRIRFTAGYAASSDTVPALIKSHLLLLVGEMEQFRSRTHYSEGARLEKADLAVLDLMAFKYTSPQVLRSLL